MADVKGAKCLPVVAWEHSDCFSAVDAVAEECAVALVYNGISHVVMMVTPTELEDFALGFSLSEGIISSPEQLFDIETKLTERGIVLSLTITGERFMVLKERRRTLAGFTGCGLCGIESLSQLVRRPRPVKREVSISHDALQHAVAKFGEGQALRRATGAAHGAAWCDKRGDIQVIREDVGRHNALDKLLGALRRSDLCGEGFVMVSSRASYEMVVKVASANIAILAAVSAPTSMAITLAETCGMTLVGYTRPGRQVIYTGLKRLEESDV